MSKKLCIASLLHRFPKSADDLPNLYCNSHEFIESFLAQVTCIECYIKL